MVNHIRASAKDPEVAANQFAVIAPVTHCAFFGGSEEMMVGELNVGDARYDYEGLIYRWFDYWLKGEKNGVVKETPKFQYYTMGLNKWQSAETWPPANAEMATFYLTSKGNANSVFGDGKLTPNRPGSEDKPDAFAYDPNYPVPITGGGFCCLGSEY